MPFTPKFVDLVRNFTTVQGTGPVTLGTAVSGYSSFADALTAGDQFYYCIQGVDRPQEREVGRGTLQADGRIARQPVQGSPTNFTSGSKTIALVAAAEWFARLDSGAGTGSIEAASRAALANALPSRGPAMLTEGGREGLFAWNASDCSAQVAADPRQGVYVASASDPSGASGAWLRKFDGPVCPEWFGAAGDDTSDDGPAIAAAISFLRATSQAYADAFYKGSARLRFGAKRYYLGSTTLDINHTLILEGDGTGLDGGVPTRLRWAAGTTGIRVHSHNTEGASGANAGGQIAGQGSVIRGLFLMGGYSGTEGEYHGIHLRGRATIEDVFVYNFQGDGLHINATASAGPGSNEGNSNLFQLNRVNANGNRNGFYVNGADANAGVAIGCNAQYNRQWGIWDSSFLGNSWIGPHLADNGLVTGAVPTVVSDGTRRYTVKAGQAAGASTNAPSGTIADNDYWRYNGDGGASPANNIPLWSSGMTVREGGAYYADEANQYYGAFINAYVEGGQGMPQTETSSALVIGGANVTGNRIRSESGFITVDDFRCNYLINDGPMELKDRFTVNNADANKAKFQIGCGNNFGTYYFSGFGFGLECYHLTDGYQPVYFGGSSLGFYHQGTTLVGQFDVNGLKLSAGKSLKVGGTQVVGAQGAPVADATDTASAITQLNALLARLRTHGLIAT